MILCLGRPEDEAPGGEAAPADLHLKVEYLLHKDGKDGKPSVRGPLVEGPFSPQAKPLAALGDGDKLHIVAPANGDSLAGFTPSGLVNRLAELGLSKEVRLKQIHLIVDNTGVGGAESFAGSFANALVAAGFNVLEIKAPFGLVRWNEQGKVYISLFKTPHEPPEINWLASNKTLNFYTGPEVQKKHQTST